MSSTTSPPSRTVLGPLTTVFTPPSSCSNVNYRLDSNQNLGGLYLAQTCVGGDSFSNDTHCFPLPQAEPPDHFEYSPGISCPAGWYTACYGVNGDHEQSTLPGLETLTGFPSLLMSETAVGCCPSGYYCDVPLQVCYSDDNDALIATSCGSGTSPATISTIAEPDYAIFAPMITMYWQPSDRLPPSTSIQMKFTVPIQSSQPSNSISSGTNTLRTTSFSVPPHPPQPSDHISSGTNTLQTTSFSVPPYLPQPSNGSSSKTKIAIGLAATVPVTVLTGLAILVICILRRGRKKRSKATESTEYIKPELEASEPRRDIAIHNWIGELPPDGIQELPAEVPNNRIGELPATDRPRELGLGLPRELEAPTVVHELEGSGVECTANHVAKRSD